MTEEEVFNRLHPDDKRAIKRFITGQIQNVLANEHGIGGKTDAVAIAVASVTRQVEARVDAKISNPSFLEEVGKILMRRRGTDVGKYIESAMTGEAKKIIREKVGEAAERIQVDISIKSAVPEGTPKGFGAF